MKRNFSTPVLDHKGAQIIDGTHGVLTFRDLSVGVLLMQLQGDPPDEKIPWFKLGMKIQNSTEEVELSINEAKMINDRVAKMHGALLVGRMAEFLDPS